MRLLGEQVFVDVEFAVRRVSVSMSNDVRGKVYVCMWLCSSHGRGDEAEGEGGVRMARMAGGRRARGWSLAVVVYGWITKGGNK